MLHCETLSATNLKTACEALAETAEFAAWLAPSFELF
jgi:hypothetical protein